MATTKIPWVINPDGTPGMTWNPVTGCTPVSEGCDNCYAQRMHRRFAKEPFSKVICHYNRLSIPQGWKKPRMIFVNSMSDLFHPDVEWNFIFKVFETIVYSPRHTYVILTKRIERAVKVLDDVYFHLMRNFSNSFGNCPPNLWLGVTAENQARADERIPILLSIPAARHFVSIEPMLGGIEIEKNLNPIECTLWDSSNCESYGDSECRYVGNESKTALNWVICGGENGYNARPCHPDWVRSLRDQCVDAGVPFFFKGWGEYKGQEKGNLIDGVLWNQIPERTLLPASGER